MTRQEFLDEVCTWGDLIDFCRDNRMDDFVEDIYDEEARNDYINECLVDWARDNTWDELYSILDRIPTGYEYYRYDYGDWDGLTDDDFYDDKQEVEEYAVANGVFDTDEEDEEEPEDEPEEEELEDEEPIEDEDLSLDEFFSSGIAVIEDLKEAERVRREQEKQLEEQLYRDSIEDFSVLFAV